MSELLKIPEAARKMHVSRQAIYAWIKLGRIQPVRTPSGRYRIPEEQLIRPVSEPQHSHEGEEQANAQ